jgi:nitrite reductase/ring-hydroxylating ferredoxin subunit
MLYMEKHAVARTGDVLPGLCRLVMAGEVEIGVFVVNGVYRAYRNFCPHAGAPICLGEITRLPGIGGRQILRCPWHAWEYDLSTGENVRLPADRLDSYPVEVVDGQIVLTI